MKIKTADFKLKPGHKLALKKHDTEIKKPYKKEEEAQEILGDSQKYIASYQDQLYARQTWSVLLILQGMDTAGKDGVIKHVLKDIDPQGGSVTSFKKPAGVELRHDFLWRTHEPMPQRGEIKVFNRSYYEDVVVPHAVPEVLEASGLPPELMKSKDLLKNRCKDIVNFEKYLANQGIVIIKVFLHLSKDEQKKRLLARIENPEKNWKVEESDIIARSQWSEYQKAYEFCLSHTSHNEAPWYIVPADDKLTSRLIVSKIMTERLCELDLSFPKVTNTQKQTLAKLKRRL